MAREGRQRKLAFQPQLLFLGNEICQETREKSHSAVCPILKVKEQNALKAKGIIDILQKETAIWAGWKCSL